MTPSPRVGSCCQAASRPTTARRSATARPARTAAPTPERRPRSPPTHPHLASGRQHRPKLRIQRDRATREMRPDLLSPLSEPAQPATHRLRIRPHPCRDPPKPLAGRHLRLDRRPDHRHLVLPTRQRNIRQQHVSARTPQTPRPPRPQQPIPAQAPQHPLPGITPRPQHRPTRRAAQKPADQLSLDPRLLGAYDQHRGATSGIQESPPDDDQSDGRALARSRTHEPCQPRDHDERHNHPLR